MTEATEPLEAEERDDAAPQDEFSQDGARPRSRLSLFLGASVPDFVLTLVAATALLFTVSYAFNSAPALRANVFACAGLVAPMLVILYIGSWSKKALAPSAVLAVVYAAIVLVALGATSSAGLFENGQINDVADNQVVFGLLAVVVPPLVYLLSRRRVGVIVLFVVSVVACGAVQFLYRDWLTAQPGLAATIVVLVSVGALFIFQSYRSAVYGAQRVAQTHFLGSAVFAALTCAICVALGALVYFLVIAGLGLSTPQFKPFTDYYKRPVIEYSGAFQKKSVENPNLTTNETNSKTDDTKKNTKGGSKGTEAPQQNQQKSSGSNTTTQQTQGYDSNNANQGFSAISYQTVAFGVLGIILLLLLAFLIVVLLVRRRRKRRYDKLLDKPRELRVWSLYRFFAGRFERMGVRKPQSYTLMEFALGSRNELAQFSNGTEGVDFLKLTLAYQRACYAPETLTEDDDKMFERYYKMFFKNARKFVGNRHWIIDFWRI